MMTETIRTADDAIRISQTEDRIVTLPYDAQIAEDLLVACDDHVETDAIHEYWGDDWRVHMLASTTTPQPRSPRQGYRPHDHATEWQECDTCQLRIGAGIETDWDDAYAEGDPSVCPRCAEHDRDGLMCLPDGDR